MAKMIHLHHREHEGLAFGPDNDIQFGLKGGFPPGELIISDDHPLYDELWRLEGPFLEIVDKAGPAKVYVSPVDPTREFKSREALNAHVRELAAQGSALARMWLEQNDEAEDRPKRGRTTAAAE